MMPTTAITVMVWRNISAAMTTLMAGSMENKRADHARRRDTPGQRVHRVGNRDSQHRRGGDDAPLGGRRMRGVTDGYRRSVQRRDRDRQGEPVEPGARLADPVGEERVQAEAHVRARREQVAGR